MVQKELAAAAGAWLTGLIPATGAVLLGYHAWMKQMADNESGEIAARNKAMKRVVIFSAVAMTASGLFTLVMTYYK